MCAKGLLLCLFAVVILHCCAAEEGREESSTWKWTSIPEIVSNMPKKIVFGCVEEVVYGTVSSICTDLGSDDCQSVVDNSWEVYHYYGLGTGTYSFLKDICNNLGNLLYRGVKAVTQISWYTVKAIVWVSGCVLHYTGYALMNGGRYMLERVPH